MLNRIQILLQSIPKIYQSSFIFFILFGIILSFYSLPEFMMKPPQGVHIWRQTDCLSITENYYNGSAKFFEPEIHNQISDAYSTGKTAGEFPIIYWTVAQIWKLTGKYEFIYRIFGLLITFIGLYSIFRLTFGITGNTLLSPLIGLFPFTSPIFVNYSVSFLPNIPAISFTFIGWGIFYLFIKKRQILILWLSILFFSLAMLIKVSAGISLVAISGWIIIDSFYNKGKDRIFNSPLKHIMPFILGWMAIISWYLYASKYNSVHGGRYTFNNIWPIWELSFYKIKESLTTARILWKNQIFANWILCLLLSIWPVTLFYIRKFSRFHLYLLISIPIGTIFYLILWFQALRDHDYYYIEIILVLTLLLITFILLLKESGRLKTFIFSTLISIVFILSLINCRNSLSERSRGWMNSWYINNLEAVYDASYMLEDLGIPDDAKIISVPDPSINSTLYFLNRKGFTDFGSNFNQEGVIQNRISKGAGFLIVNDSSILDNDQFRPYLGYQIGKYRSVTFFDLRPYSERFKD